MQELTEKQIRNSFVNASRREVAQLPLPNDLDTCDWDNLDLLAWSDPRDRRRSFVVAPARERVVGFILTSTQSNIGKRAMCVWCEDIKETSEVGMFSAKLAGAAGRKGDTVATLIHSDFDCSRFVRRQPTPMEGGDDPEQFIETRIARLREHLEGFARKVAGLA
ncbi:treble-clef zinc-finger protein [Antricoccus suffuscus]|uniref:Treble-clef zinc-finger protein n=1 Tax=Antricoccus suffuscus TaxID=1629062 RepID=A0A2T1A3L4_9ACTN|nr:FBP domain-containing protein [Antricoccus suffuscus]PRZ43193.1 treble-clef zinc-finger protein [Antricoccus suffuscus]